MKSLFLPFIFGLILTACGGGGGGGSSPTTPPAPPVGFIKSVQTDYAEMISMTQGRFKADTETYVLVTGNQILMGGTVPINIFKLNINGAGTDVTADILGPNPPTISSGDPIVADFNHDGIDDIFLAGWVDQPSQLTASHVFLSQPGTYHRHVLLESTQSWSATAADINNDGHLDVIDSEGKMWINDGAGNFTFKDHSWNNSLFWMHGTGVCVGDFLNTGNKQIVITDLNDSGALSINDTVIFELNASLKPITRTFLPPPILEIGNTGTIEISHDVRCKAADMNNDGLLDVVVFSRPWAAARNGVWTAENRIQILINQGNLNFVDQTNLVGFDLNKDLDYFPRVQDYNGDGIPDIWATPQLLIGGNGAWTRRLYSQVPTQGVSLPVKMNGQWGFVYIKNVDYNRNEIYFTKPDLTIDL